MSWGSVGVDVGEVRRLGVPGGWLYQVAYADSEESTANGVPRIYHIGWHPPVFVADAVRVDTSKLDEIIRNLEKLRINDWDSTLADRIAARLAQARRQDDVAMAGRCHRAQSVVDAVELERMMGGAR